VYVLCGLQVLDRLLLARLLQQLQSLQLPRGVRARGPVFYEVAAFDADSVAAVTAAGILVHALMVLAYS